VRLSSAALFSGSATFAQTIDVDEKYVFPNMPALLPRIAGRL